jgi:hypothetical protein
VRHRQCQLAPVIGVVNEALTVGLVPGKGRRAVARLKSMHDAFDLVREEAYSSLYWNLRHTFWYLVPTPGIW